MTRRTLKHELPIGTPIQWNDCDGAPLHIGDRVQFTFVITDWDDDMPNSRTYSGTGEIRMTTFGAFITNADPYLSRSVTVTKKRWMRKVEES